MGHKHAPGRATPHPAADAPAAPPSAPEPLSAERTPSSPGPEGGHAGRRRRRGGARHRASRRGFRARLASPLAALAVLVIAGGVTAFVVLRPTSGESAASGSSAPAGAGSSTVSGAPPTSPGSGSSSAATPLARWVIGELPSDARLVAQPSLAARLRDAGLPAERVGATSRAAAPTGGPSPTFLVTDGQAPAGGRVIARFDGDGGPPLLVVDPSPGTPTAQEMALRRSLATAILANPTTGVSGGPAAVLRAADVDPRLLSLLAVLVARSGVGIADFLPPPGVPADGVLARRALVDSVGGTPLRPGSAVTDAFVAWLHAQLPPYAPDSVTVTDRGVLIGYHYASDPDAVVAQATR